MLSTRLSRHLPQLVLLANAGAFGALLLELAILDHWDGIQLVAPLTAAAGAALSLGAIVIPARLRMVPAGLLAVLAVAGLVGFAQHLDERDVGFLRVGVVQAHDGEDHDDDHDSDEHEHEPPPLAPLALSGTAMVSAAAALAASARR